MAQTKTKPTPTETPQIPATEAELKKIINRMSKRRADIAEADAQVKRDEVPLRNLKDKLQKLKNEQDADEAIVKGWINANPEKLTGPKSTLDIGKAVLSLPAKPASIENIDGFTDDDVISACEKAGKTEYVRVAKTLDRKILNADWNSQRISERELKKLGLFPNTTPEPKVKLKKM